MIKGAWGYQQGKLSDDEYQKMLDEEVMPKLEEMKQIARDVFVPKVVHGFFRCHADGDALVIDDPEGGEIRMPFPRSTKGPKLCLSDFFRPDQDLCALMAVTLGKQVMDKEHELRDADRYHDYLLFHGLAVMTAEALAETWHKQIRELWGSTEGELTLSEIWKNKLDQSRFGFGYAACPDLAMNKVCCDLLDTDRIGLNVTELFMADPECSTFALITHHPQACYFDL
jgi:5-methyltetrahydrofolate--homocysteine methyltransferase